MEIAVVMDKIYNKSLLIIIFLVFATWSNAIYNAAVSISMGLLLAWIIIDLIRYKSWHKFRVPKVLMFSVGTYLIGVLLANSIVGGAKNISNALDYIYWAAPMLLIIYSCRNPNIIPAVNWGMIVSIFYTSFASLYQIYYRLTDLVFEAYISSLPYGNRITGFYYNPNFYAVLLILILPFVVIWTIQAFRGKRYNFLLFANIIALIVGVISLIGTFSRGSILGLCLGGLITLIAYGIIYKKYKVIGFALALGFLGWLGVELLAQIKASYGVYRSYDNERLLLWKSSYYMWKDHKLFGVGFHEWQYFYQQQYILLEARERTLEMPHNNIAWFFSATGVLGGSAFIVFLVGIVSYLVRAIKKRFSNNYILYAMMWAFLGLLFQGMVDVGFTMKSSARLFFVLLGLAVASSNYENVEKHLLN